LDSPLMRGLFALAILSLLACGRGTETYREAHGSGACESGACAGHEAGWRWARARRIDDPNKCGGRSESFIEGCRAYAGGD